MTTASPRPVEILATSYSTNASRPTIWHAAYRVASNGAIIASCNGRWLGASAITYALTDDRPRYGRVCQRCAKLLPAPELDLNLNTTTQQLDPESAS